MLTQLCYTTFIDGILRNGYISCKANIDAEGRTDPTSPGLDHPIQWLHDGERQGIVYDADNNHAYRLNASYQSTLAFVESLLNIS
jgi:hypothetical protein